MPASDTMPEVQSRTAIPIFGLGPQQRSPFLSTVKRVNAIVEMTENGRQQAALIGMAGLSTYFTVGSRPARAHFVREGELTFYGVFDDQIVKLQANTTPVVIGVFTTLEGPVWIADNGTQLFINDGVKAFAASGGRAWPAAPARRREQMCRRYTRPHTRRRYGRSRPSE